MKNKAMIGAVLAIVALILLSLTFVTAWYSVTFEVGDEDMTNDFYFTETESDGETEEYEDDSDVGDTFSNTRILVVVAIIGTILGIIGALMVAMEKMSPKIGAILVLIGFIFALIAPVYLMVELPNAMEEDETGVEGMQEDFFGSEETDFGDISWGGTTAWFMAIVAGILNIVAMGLVITTKEGPEPVQRQQPPQEQPPQGWEEEPEPEYEEEIGTQDPDEEEELEWD